MAAFVQIAAVAILLYWCYTIVAPFVAIVVWAVILSVALYPAHVALGGREKISATMARRTSPVVRGSSSTSSAIFSVSSGATGR